MRGLMSSSAADGGRLAAATRQLVRGALLPLLGHRQLSPLAVCLPSVVAEFRHQAAALGLVELSALNSAVSKGSFVHVSECRMREGVVKPCRHKLAS